MRRKLFMLMLLCMVCMGAWANVAPGSYAIKVYGTEKYLNPTNDWSVKGSDKVGYTTSERPAWKVVAGKSEGTNAITVEGSVQALNPYHYGHATDPKTTVGCWAPSNGEFENDGDAEWKIEEVEGKGGVYTIKSNTKNCYLIHNEQESNYLLMTGTDADFATWFEFECLDTPEAPLLTIGCVSDVHCMNNMITPPNGNLDDITVRSSLTTVLNRMKTEDKPDVLIFGGDSESDKTIDEENSIKVRQVLAEAMRSVFEEGKNPNVLWLTGNHDYEVANFNSDKNVVTTKPYNAGNFYDFPMKQEVGVLSESDLFYEEADNGEYGTERILAAYHYVLNGFDFVVLNCGKYFFHKAWDYTFSTESCTWVKDKLQEIDPDGTKTVFFLCHVPFPDSNSLNDGKGMNDTEGYPILKAACAAHPNLIMLYGHDHGKDDAYIREKTSQRVTLYDIDGKKIATTDANHVDGTTKGEEAPAGGETSEELLLSNICLKSLSGSFFGIGSSDVSVLSAPYALKLEAFSGATNGYSLKSNDGSLKINSGSNGYLSKSTGDNRPFYFYEVTSNNGSSIEAKLVEGPIAGKTYLIGLSSIHSSAHGFYVMYCNMANSTRFDVVRINNSSASNPTVPTTITLNATTTSVATSSAIDFNKVLWRVEKVLTTGTFYVTHNGQHLIKDSNNLNLGSTETEHALSKGSVDGTFKLKTSSSQYLHIGSSGRWSDGTANNLLLFDTEGKRIYNIVSGQPYYIVALYSSNNTYYAMKGAVYSPGTDGQRMDTQSVTLNSDNTQMTSTPGADFQWTFTDVNAPKPTPTTEPSFFSSFMGSLRYYYNSIDAGDPADSPTVVQALVVKVYGDRVELHMKNYNQTGTISGITIAQTPTPYTSFRTVAHSDEKEYAKDDKFSVTFHKYQASEEKAYATFYQYAPAQLPEGVYAYTATVASEAPDVLTLTKIEGDVVPANTAVVMHSATVVTGENTSATIQLQRVSEEGTAVEGNILEGTLAKTAKPKSDYTYYVLGKKSGMGFYKYTAATLPDHRAYFRVGNAEGQVAAYHFEFADDILTYIDAIESENSGAEIFDINGRRLQKAQKGMNIINGQKVFVK